MTALLFLLYIIKKSYKLPLEVYKSGLYQRAVINILQCEINITLKIKCSCTRFVLNFLKIINYIFHQMSKVSLIQQSQYLCKFICLKIKVERNLCQTIEKNILVNKIRKDKRMFFYKFTFNPTSALLNNFLP